MYSGKVLNPKDFEPTTSEAGKREKEYQLKIMNLLQEGKLSPNPVFGPNTIPFEMEYGIKTNERKKRFAKEKIYIPEGRVDNVFFDGETVNLVEIKIGTAVMDGSNGIHKHLLDIAHCCVKHPIITVADFQNLIQEKGKSANINAIKALNELNIFYENQIKNEKENYFEIPYTTMNIGILEGGSAKNSIPASAKACLDFRTIKDIHAKKIKDKLNRIIFKI